jgi:hypothetical protein
MWLNFIILIIASLCVGFILGWIVARPRRWGGFDTPGTEGEDPTDANPLVRRA